jgi:predicted nucleic acid-binding protein
MGCGRSSVIVVDASTVVEYLVGAGAVAAWSTAALQDADMISAPAHLHAEVGSTLRGLRRAERLSDETLAAALVDLADMPITVVASDPFMARAMQLRENATFYDALYIAAAEHLGCPLVTTDGKYRAVVAAAKSAVAVRCPG